MSYKLLFNQLWLISFFLFYFASCSLQALVVWTDNPGPLTMNTPDAFDDDVLLQDPFIRIGLNSGGSGDYEAAITSFAVPVLVTMNPLNAGTTVAGSSFNAGIVNGSRLYLQTLMPSSTITFIIDQDLTFLGSAFGAATSANNSLDLLVIVKGPGQVIFQFNGGNTVTLSQNLTTGVGGAVQMYVQQKTGFIIDPDPGYLLFKRSATDPSPNSDVEFAVEGGSILSYLSLTAQPNALPDETGTIAWDVFTPSDGTGRMILTIGRLGAVIVRGRLFTNPANTSLYDIFPQTPAGYNALFAVVNSDLAPVTPENINLQIQNYNDTLGEFIWDPWDTLQVRELPPFGNFSGVQWGFIVGSYGQLNVGGNIPQIIVLGDPVVDVPGGPTYLDYVSLTGTQCPAGVNTCEAKARNPSALFTDGEPSPDFIAPLINIGSNAAIFFRSGVDNCGNVGPTTGPDAFTVDPMKKTCGAGFPVFDIEGPLTIMGANVGTTQASAFELLSLEVAPTGGSLFVGDGQTIFPLRTYAKVPGTDPCTGQDETVYLTYNNASFLNNGRVNLCSVSFTQTDQNHHVFENNDVCSEPAYIGGETWKLIPCISKPKWAFANSIFNVQTSVALTGVDLLVPEDSFCTTSTCLDNESIFYFYQNGYKVDNGNGRQMILGTFLGSTACDGCTVINKDAHLDVMQTATCACCVSQELFLRNLPNDHTIVEAIPIGADLNVLANQYSVQTIYLGNSSNISIGTEGDMGTSMEVTTTMQYHFELTTFPTLVIDGNFFSFETRGGQNGLPATSNVTGQGGIFVDTNGVFTIGSAVCGYRTNIGTMVTISSNGVINLPKNRVFFDPTVGIATWNVNLSDQTVIVPAGANYSDYNLNWMFTEKNYDIFTPYAINCYNVCFCPPVTEENVSGIPTVEGSVQQFQLQGSRIGDPAHLKVNGGIIGELVMLVGFNSAEAPVAVLVLENNAVVGLGSTHRNVDSLCASVQLGVNGINIIVDGDDSAPGSSNITVILNEDVIVNNTCSILAGPNIAPDAVLRITSDTSTLRVTADGILDLSSFTAGQTIEFGGSINVVFEPGAMVSYGAGLGTGPTLRFTDNAACIFEPVFNLNIFGPDLTGTDDVRVVFTGTGILEFAESSVGDIKQNAFVGIQSETTICDSLGADVRLRITDSAKFYIGNTLADIPGGTLQIGNTVSVGDSVITFSLILDGPEAVFEIGPQGFFGAGVGIVNKPLTGHDAWLIAPTANILNISIDLQNGSFRHAQLYAGSDSRSALFALSDSIDGSPTPFNFSSVPVFENNFSGTLLSNTPILGGGNFIAVSNTAVPFNPVVDAQNGLISPSYTAGLLASIPLMETNTFADLDAFAAQLFLRVQDVTITAPTTNRGVAAPSQFKNQVRIGYVDTAGVLGSEGFIARVEVMQIIGKSAQTNVQGHTLRIGVAQLGLAQTGPAPRALIGTTEIGN